MGATEQFRRHPMTGVCLTQHAYLHLRIRAAIGERGDRVLAGVLEGVIERTGILADCGKSAVDQPHHLAARTECAEPQTGRFAAVWWARNRGVVGDAGDTDRLARIQPVWRAARCERRNRAAPFQFT